MPYLGVLRYLVGYPHFEIAGLLDDTVALNPRSAFDMPFTVAITFQLVGSDRSAFSLLLIV